MLYFLPFILGNSYLLRQLVARDIQARYKGSVMGMLWSFLMPLLMLGVYSFVFGVVFKAKWGTDISTDVEGSYSAQLFVGLVLYTLFSEVLNRAPALIVGNANYVKKVVFPVALLPVVTAFTALFHAAVGFAVMLVFCLVVGQPIQVEFALLVFLGLLITVLALGISWMLAAFGVYFRDLQHVIGIITSVLLFLSPVFYPVEALPKMFHTVIYLNPLTLIIESSRAAAFGGGIPWVALATYALLSLLCAEAGFRVFQRLKRGFPDEL